MISSCNLDFWFLDLWIHPKARGRTVALGAIWDAWGNPPHCFRCGGLLGPSCAFFAAIMVLAGLTRGFFCVPRRLNWRATWFFLGLLWVLGVIRSIASDAVDFCACSFVCICGSSLAFFGADFGLLFHLVIENLDFWIYEHIRKHVAALAVVTSCYLEPWFLNLKPCSYISFNEALGGLLKTT